MIPRKRVSRKRGRWSRNRNGRKRRSGRRISLEKWRFRTRSSNRGRCFYEVFRFSILSRRDRGWIRNIWIRIIRSIQEVGIRVWVTSEWV